MSNPCPLVELTGALRNVFGGQQIGPPTDIQPNIDLGRWAISLLDAHVKLVETFTPSSLRT